jgi:hypothetical protein
MKTQKLYSTLFIVLSGLLIFTAGCKKGGVTASGSSSDNSTDSLVAISTFQGQVRADWLIISNKAQTANATVIFTGTCARGVADIQILINGSASGITDPKCQTDLTWTASKTIGIDGDYEFSFRPTKVSGDVITSGIVTQTVSIDTTVPSDPVITTNGGADIDQTSGSVSLAGTISADTSRMTVSDSTGTLSVNTTADTFTFTSTLTAGQSRTYTFYSYDIVGNQSGAETIIVTYLANSAPIVYAFSTFDMATAQTSSTTTNKLHQVAGSQFITPTTLQTSSTTTTKLGTGFVNISQ